MASGHYETRRVVKGEDAYGRPIYETVQVWVADPAPAKTAAPAPPKSAPVKPPAPAKPANPYTFNGRSYASYNAYVAAVTSYKRAVAAQRARLAEQARARAEAQREREQKRRAAVVTSDTRRRAERIAQERRSKAYAELQERVRQLRERRLTQDDRRDQVAEAYQAERDERVDYQKGERGFSKGPQSVADQRREKAIADAVATGDFETAIQSVRDRQLKTGGRYVDRKLLEQINTTLETQKTAADAKVMSLVERIEALVAAGKVDEAIALRDSAESQAAIAEFTRLRGDGRQPGLLQRVAGVQNQIADSYDNWLEAQIIGPRTGELLSGAQLTQAIGEFREQNLTVDRRGGAQEFGDFGRAIGINDWLRRQANMEQAQIMQRWRQAQGRMRLSRYEGLAVGVDGEGRPFYVNKQAARDFQAAQGILQRSGQQGKVEELMGLFQGGSPAERDRALRELLAIAEEQWKRENAGNLDKIFNAVTDDTSDTPGAQLGEERESVERFRRWFFATMSGGAELPGGLVGGLYNLSGMPVLGLGLQGLGWGVGGIGSAIKIATAALSGGGRLRLPDVNFTAPFNGRWGDTFKWDGLIDTSPEAKAETMEDMLALMQAIGNPNARLDDRLNQIAQFGSKFAYGNTSILAEQVIDPLSFLGVGRFLNAGRMASIRQGGLREALRAPGATARDFLNTLAPNRADAARVEEAVRRMELARQIGRPYDEIAGLSDNEITDLIEGTIDLSADQARKQGIWKRLFEEDPVNAQQLFAAVSREGESLLKQYGRVIDPAKLEQALRRVDIAKEQAEREAAAIAARQARVASEAKLAQAVDTVRAEQAATVPVPKAATPLSAAQQALRGKLVREYVDLAQERVDAARRAADLGQTIRESRDFAEQSAAFDEFEPLVRRIDELNDQWVEGPDGWERSQGLVSRRRAALEEFDHQHRVTPQARAHDIGLQRIDSDIGYVSGRINQLAAQRRVALPADLPHIDAELKRYYAARDGLRVERQVLRASRSAARRIAQRFAPELTKLVSLNRVAPRALSDEESTLWLLRDLRSRGLHATRQPAHLPLAPQDVKFLDDLEISLGLQIQGRPVANLGKLAADFGDVEVLDLWYALKSGGFQSQEVQNWLSMVDGAIHTLWGGRTGHSVSRKRAVGELAELMQRRMIDSGPLGWAGYRKADELVAANLEKVRGFRAEGQIRVGRNADPSTEVNPFRDSDFATVYAKLAALRDAGTTLDAYDLSRSVMRNPMLRFESARGIRARAAKLGSRVGATAGEAFDRIREARRMQEIRRNIEEITMQPGMAGLSDDEVFSAISAQYIHDDLRPFVQQELTDFQVRQLDAAYTELAGHSLFSEQAANHLRSTGPRPEFGNRQAMRDWMVENGHWSPRTADDIRAGGRVLSIEDESRFWETNFGYKPPWTDPVRLEQVVHSKEAFDAFMREQGVLNDDFEQILSTQHLTVEEIRGQIVFGGPNVKRARTYREIRSWVQARFGPVANGPHGLRAFPWLMDPRHAEYEAWVREVVSDNGKLAQAGIELADDLIKPQQREAFGRAINAAVQRSVERVVETLDEAVGHNFLPQQFNAFAYDVVDHLLADPNWRGLLDDGPMGLGRRVLNNLAAFWRALVSWTPAFINMNLIDAYGPKRGLLIMMENGWRPLSRVSARSKELIPDLERGGITRESVWMVRGRNGFRNAFDNQFGAWKRAQEGVRGVTELPLRVSKFGEDHLRLDFMRSAFDREVERLKAIGFDPDQIERRALAHARQRIDSWFPEMGNSTIERLINQLVPFFSYNVKLKMLGVRIAVEHPWVPLLMQRLSEFAESVNREQWEADHPNGEPFPADDPRAGWLWVKIGDQTYAVDLGGYSDWVRGLDVVFESHTPAEWVTEFFRVPHPSQAIFLAKAFGFNDGKTPWGTEARWEDVSLWFDFTSWLMQGGQDAFDPNNPKSRDAIQVFSQMLFFKGFSRINPMTAKVQQFFAFMELDPDKAWAYYNANPDLQGYFQLTGHQRYNNRGLPTRISWFSQATAEEKDRYDSALAGYEKLRDSLDAKLDEFYLQPWSPEYRKWKQYRRGLLAGYLRDNPLLGEVWGYWKSPDEWARDLDDWQTDELVDQYFAMEDGRPVPADYASELEFQVALDAWIDQRKAWLEAHPTVADRLHSSRNAVERAWFDHQLQWMEILDDQASVRIQILTEEAKGASADRDLIGLLHDLSDLNYTRLDAESFGEFYDLMDSEFAAGGDLVPRTGIPSLLSSIMNRVKHTVVFPGRADYFYETASVAEKRQIEADERYFGAIGTFMDKLKDPRQFWTELEANPELMAEYLARNPDRKVDYQYVKGIRAVFNAGGPLKFWDNLIARPALLAEYLKRNPDARAKYDRYRTGKRYFAEIQALFKSSSGPQDFYNKLEANPWLRDQYYARNPEKRGNSKYFQRITELFRSSTDARAFFAALDKDPWLKAEYFRRHPDKAASYGAGKEYFGWMQRWVRALDAGNFELGGQIWESMPDWVKERYFEGDPERRGKAVQTAEYVAAMGRWVELLRSKDYVAAQRYFNAMPEWMRERYFEKHPDQRAKFEMDGAMLSRAAHYLVAADADKIAILERSPDLRRWLAEHGGKESAYRGLIMAAYRNLPPAEAWLRRVFREKYPEVFGQEAAGERRRASVARELADHPELQPFYDRALEIQQQTYLAQLRRGGTPPKPLTIERKRRLRARSRRRRARYASHWAMHREMRLNLRRA